VFSGRAQVFFWRTQVFSGRPQVFSGRAQVFSDSTAGRADPAGGGEKKRQFTTKNTKNTKKGGKDKDYKQAFRTFSCIVVNLTGAPYWGRMIAWTLKLFSSIS
jgi:hypothetical protein